MPAARGVFDRRLPGVVVALSLSLVTLAAAPVPQPPTTGRVTGTVRDGAGAPVAHAQLQVVGTALTALSDTAGVYLLPAVPAGPVTVRATRAGFGPVELAGTVRAGATLTLNFTLAAGRREADELAKVKAAESRADRAQLRDMAAPQAAAGTVNAAMAPGEPWRYRQEPWNTESYNVINENRFLGALSNPLSTFSIDVDAASYSNVRRFLSQGALPPKDAVRLEELVNYFPYDYPDRSGEHPFGVFTEVSPCPWTPEHRLVRIGLQARRIPTKDLPQSNLVFLIDVSGSMDPPDKLPLVQQAFRAFVRELRPEDRVAIVVYAGAAGLVLPPTSGSDKRDYPRRDRPAPRRRLDRGRRWDQARVRHCRGELRRGGQQPGHPRDRRRLQRRRQQRRGDGAAHRAAPRAGDLPDASSASARESQGLEDGAARRQGNGHYAYIDSFREAQKVFVQEFGGTLFTVAKDVKIQVEFNPARVQSYRLLGYENRLLAKEDFKDDRKDAGELGSGHSVTALYEVVPVGAKAVAQDDDSLTYQQVSLRPGASTAASCSRCGSATRTRRARRASCWSSR